jgi:hypothetical protein
MSSFGRQGQSVRLAAGAVHGDPADQRVFGYSWGALAWNPKAQSWELGWAPRVFAGGEMRADRTNHDLDAAGFAWKPLQLPWRQPEAPRALAR